MPDRVQHTNDVLKLTHLAQGTYRSGPQRFVVVAVCELTIWILRPSPARKTNKDATVGTALVDRRVSKASLFIEVRPRCAASSRDPPRVCRGAGAGVATDPDPLFLGSWPLGPRDPRSTPKPSGVFQKHQKQNPPGTKKQKQKEKQMQKEHQKQKRTQLPQGQEDPASKKARSEPR